MFKSLLLIQEDFEPVTVALPFEPLTRPTAALKLVTLAPFLMVSLAVFRAEMALAMKRFLLLMRVRVVVVPSRTIEPPPLLVIVAFAPGVCRQG